MTVHRRQWLAAALAAAALGPRQSLAWDFRARRAAPLIITRLRVTPIALPDPPLLAASGCHGPYFLRNVIELQTDGGIGGIAETHGGQRITDTLNAATEFVVGNNAFAYRAIAQHLANESPAVYAGLELACLDACGKATGARLCELLGGPVREEVEFAAYLFFRYAADHPAVLDDERLKDNRGRGERALDDWGEVRTPGAMATMAERFHRRFGFRVFKLKAGVLPPEQEVAALRAINERFSGRYALRIDPNARWTVETAIRAAEPMKGLPLEYYEDPVAGQVDMARVRLATGLVMSTNMCVTRFEHVPSALRHKCIDVVLGDHHGWGGITAFQALGEICTVAGWKLSQHSNNHAGITMAAMTHVGAAVPQLTLASDTHYPWLPDGADIIQGDNLRFQHGRLKVPAGPGLGVELDQDKLARAHEIYRKCGMRSRDDGATMQRFEPGWRRTLY